MTEARIPEVEQIIAGGGEMGEMIRTYDWSSTPIGSPEEWPQSLRTAISIMLETHFPMYIAWGEDFTQFYNDGYRPILGITKHPAIGKSTRETFAEIWDIIGPMFDGVMEGKAVGVTDFLLPLNRYGYTEECYFIFSYSPIRDESGGVGGVLVTVTETTTRVIEERRLKTLRDMAKRASLVKTLSDAWEQIALTLEENDFDIPFALTYEADKDGLQARLINAVRSDGHTYINEVIDIEDPGNADELVSRVFNSAKAELNDCPGEIVAGAWPEPVKNVYAVPLPRPDKDKPVDVIVLGINPRKEFDDSSATFYNLFANHAATAVNNALAYEAEKQRTEALLEIDKAKTAFFSNISHEFRTPLTLMLGPLEDILDQKESIVPEKILNSVETTHRNAMRLLKLVNTLLDFSRIEAGKLQAHYQPVDLCTLTINLASSFRSIIEKAGLVFKVDCYNTGQVAYVDKEMWEKIVLNLLSNAYKYTLDGSIKITLTSDRNKVCLEVKDTGVGIPENELPHMFERFHRINHAVGRTYEGTGIGLSLVAELVKLHGGDITVSSQEHKGSTFSVTIPLGKDHLPASQVLDKAADLDSLLSEAYLLEADSLLSNDTGETENDAAGLMHILVADDNPDMRNYIASLLSKEYIIDTANDGRQALEKMRQHKPALVISDIMMPGIDGIELLRTIKNDETLGNIPVILLSARVGEESRIEGYEVGADDYLVKPFSAKELIARVHSQLKVARKRNHIEEQLKNLFEQAPVAICIFRGPGHIVELANEEMLEIWGKRAEQVLHKPLFEGMPDAAGQGFEQILDNVYDTGERFIGHELPIDLLRNGEKETVYVKFVYEALREEDGSISGIMAVATEITEQVMVRKTIEESETKLRMAIESTRLGTWEYNPISGELHWSRECRQIYGVNDDVVIDFELFSEHVYPADRDRALQAIENAMKPEGGGNYDISYRIIRFDDNSVHWIHARGKVYFLPDGRAERFIGTVIDITSQKNYEEALLASEQRTRLAIEAADLGTYEWDMVKDEAFFSDRIYEIFGIAKKENIEYSDILHAIYPEDDPIRRKAIEDAAVKGSMEYEVRILWPDKTIHWIKNTGVVLFDEQKKPLRMYGAVMDITEQKLRAEELERKVAERTHELKETITDLARSNSDLEQFAYVASHDLKEPIRMVSAYTSLLKERYKQSLPDEAKDYISFILDGTNRMQHLVRDLLEYSRIGASNANFSKISCNEVIRNVKQNLKELILQKDAVIEQDELPPVKGIETQLVQLFQNLVENAIKFKGTERPRIKISVAGEGTYWRFSISDNGIGIPAEYFNKIFAIFQRLHTRNEYEGTGIGLSVCKKIVELHGGRLWVESEPGKGSNFQFTLPKIL